MYAENFGEFYNNQIENATTIVISRTQLMDEAAVKDVYDFLREHNKEALIITTPWDKLEGDVIKDAIEHGHDLEAELMEEYRKHPHEHHHHDHDHEHHHHHHDHDHDEHDHDHDEHEHHHDHDHEEHDHDHDEHEHHHDHEHDEHDHDHEHEHEHHHHHDHDHDHHHHHDHDHDADEVFDSWGVETIHKFTKEGIEAVLNTLSTSDEFGTVLRAKGIVETEDGQWVEFDMVPDEMEIRECNPNFIGKICVIGADLKEDTLAEEFGA